MNDHGPEEFNPQDFLASFRHIAVGVLMSPRAFFQQMRRTGGFLPPLIFMAACLLIHTLIVGLLHKDMALMGRNLALGLLFPFITAGLAYILLTQVFRTRGTFKSAFRVNAYAAAVNLLSWFPMVGALFEFYRLYVITLGLCATFETSPWKAFGALTIIMIAYILLARALTPLAGGMM